MKIKTERKIKMNTLTKMNNRSKWQRLVAVFLCVIFAFGALAMPAYAAGEKTEFTVETGNEALDGPFNLIINLVASIVLGFGIIRLLMGIVSFSNSIGAHDDQQRSSGIWSMVGGAILIAGPAIVLWLVNAVNG